MYNSDILFNLLSYFFHLIYPLRESFILWREKTYYITFFSSILLDNSTFSLFIKRGLVEWSKIEFRRLQVACFEFSFISILQYKYTYL